jgi:hypothetical protein
VEVVMVQEFKREQRYIIAKRKHLSAEQERRLCELLSSFNLPFFQGVVVESDWPEYETVWAMIEARCLGTASPGNWQETINELADLQAELAEARAEVERLRERNKTIERHLIKAIDMISDMNGLINEISGTRSFAAKMIQEAARQALAGKETP